MRWSDLYIGLLAAMFGFAALIVGLQGALWYVPAAFLVAAAAALVLMAWRTAHTPKVLLVGEDTGGRLNRLYDAIDDGGFGVVWCAGPDRRPCPALHGGSCPVGGRPVAAIVSTPVSYGGPVPPCGLALGIRQWELGSDIPPRAVARGLRELIGPA